MLSVNGPQASCPAGVVASMSELISVAEAEALIARHMPAFGSERVRLAGADGRVLRQRVRTEDGFRDHTLVAQLAHEFVRRPEYEAEEVGVR